MKRIHFIAFNIMAAIFIITAVLGINGCHKNKSQTDYNILVIHSFDSLYTWGKEKRCFFSPQSLGKDQTFLSEL